jgi:Na+/melibiose symporter-like transporter
MDTEKVSTQQVAESNKVGKTSVSQAWNIIMSVVMAIIGLVFISNFDTHKISNAVLFIGGVAFILPGVALLLSLLVSRKAKVKTTENQDAPVEKPRGMVLNLIAAICGVATVALGIVILAYPDPFKPLLVYLFGGLLIISAAWQFDIMIRKNREVLYPTWLIVAPIAIVALGVVMCTADVFKGEPNEKWMLLASGCGFTVFGLIGLCISYFAIKKRSLADRTEA